VFSPGLYLQSVLDSAEVELSTQDLTHLTADNCSDEVRTIYEAEKKRPFDYSSPPLMRGTLLCTGTAEYLLMLFVDHIVTDAWSVGIIYRDLKALYRDSLHPPTEEVDDPGLSFVDFARWQNEMLQTSFYHEDAIYWQRQWAQFASARIGFKDIPFVQNRREVDYTFQAEAISLDSTSCRKIKFLTRDRRITVYAFFLAACALLLRHYTHKCAVGLWSHFSNRTRPETHNIVGFLANTHLIGLDLTSDPTGEELLMQSHSTAVEALKHQEIPIAHLWHMLGCHPRYPDATVLLDFRTEMSSVRAVKSTSDLEMTRCAPPGTRPARLSRLGFYVEASEETITIRVEYSIARFPACAVRQMLEDLRLVINGMMSPRDIRVSSFSDLSQRYGPTLISPSTAEMGEFIVLSSDLIPAFDASVCK
jgi:myxalamid-type nonribosomal peptide synthetase MxaA